MILTWSLWFLSMVTWYWCKFVTWSGIRVIEVRIFTFLMLCVCTVIVFSTVIWVRDHSCSMSFAVFWYVHWNYIQSIQDNLFQENAIFVIESIKWWIIMLLSLRQANVFLLKKYFYSFLNGINSLSILLAKNKYNALFNKQC